MKVIDTKQDQSDRQSDRQSDSEHNFKLGGFKEEQSDHLEDL